MVQALATFVIPIAPHHIKRSAAAIASVRAQTLPSVVITAVDEDRRGPAYARNRALERVTTPFVVFLDADDHVAPDFVEKTFSAWHDGHYVYSDWQQGTKHMHSDTPWNNKGDWHVITALIPTEYVRMVGGFDEDLLGAEDTYLYWALTRSGVCGIRVPEVLFYYGIGGRRSQSFVGSEHHIPTMKALMEKYEGKMGCCGDTGTMPAPTVRPGDVLAYATWDGNRVERGRATGRPYPRTGNGKIESVDPLDVAAAPHLWRLVEQPKALPKIEIPPANAQPIPSVKPPPPGVVATAGGRVLDVIVPPAELEPLEGIEAVAAALWPNRETPKEEVTLESIQAVKPAKVKPNTTKVRNLAQNSKRKNA